MFKECKYRIYPTAIQKELIDKHIGACRFVYNLALETKIYAYRSQGLNLSDFDLMKQLPPLKKDLAWLNDVNAHSLEYSITCLDNAYKNLFAGRASFPRFKKKKNAGSFISREDCKLKEGRLSITKFRDGLKIKLHREFDGKIKRCTISKTPTGKYFASLLIDTGTALPHKSVANPNTTIGIDLGLKSFLVTSEGQTIDNPKFLRKSLAKLKYVQRKYSKHKGKRTRKKLATIHERVANQRKDFLHKTSSMLIKNHDSIAIEDLSVTNMVKNHSLALSISDAGWGKFKRQMEYKADWHGKNLLKIDRFEPSSKTCSSCGFINQYLTLNNRKWSCKCGIVHDRDLNAAINIKNIALKNYLSGIDRENRGELPELSGALTLEIHLG